MGRSIRSAIAIAAWALIAGPAAAATVIDVPVGAPEVGFDALSVPLSDSRATLPQVPPVNATPQRRLALVEQESAFELPEPAGWAMLLVGFGVAGAAVRGRGKSHLRQFS